MLIRSNRVKSIRVSIMQNENMSERPHIEACGQAHSHAVVLVIEKESSLKSCYVVQSSQSERNVFRDFINSSGNITRNDIRGQTSRASELHLITHGVCRVCRVP